MKIAVCVKHVPAGRVRLQPDTHRLDRSGPGELNDADKHAIEEAVRLAEASGVTNGAEVVAVTAGPAAADESLRNALALGADRAVHVRDDAMVGADLVATSTVLAAALARETADLVLFGQQTSDGGGAVLWAAVADRLGRPFVSQASQVEMGDGVVVVHRETEYGDDTIEARLPALIAVSDAINEPRYTSLKGRMAAKKKPLDVVSVADLGLDEGAAGDAGARTEVFSVGPPPVRGGTIRLDDEAGAADAIVAYLAERDLL